MKKQRSIFFNHTYKIGIFLPRRLYNHVPNKVDKLAFGFKAVIGEIDRSLFSVDFCTLNEVNEFDFILYSVCSFLDYVILIRDFFKKNFKSKIIIGGPALVNPILLKNVVDVQVFGRAEGIINDVLLGRKLPSVWRRDTDPNFNLKYVWRQPAKLLKVGNRTENNVGCSKNCYFCQYGYVYKQFIKTNTYNSGLDSLETLFNDIDFDKATSRVVSSIDGSTEKTRKRVNKPLSGSRIINKIKEAYNVRNNKPLRLTLYNIIGYPFENEKVCSLKEILYFLKRADLNKKRKDLWLHFKFMHFIPFPLSHFQYLPFNFTDFRTLIFSRFGFELYKGVNIHSYIYKSFPSYLYAADNLYIMRAFEIDDHILKMTRNKYYKYMSEYRLDFYNNCSLLHKQFKLPSDKIIVEHQATI